MTQKEIVRVGLLTPYLTEEIRDPATLYIQTTLAGYESDNMRGATQLETPKHVVQLFSPRYVGGIGRAVKPSEVAGFHLLFMGSTRDGEREAQTLSATKVPIARFSMFYGGPSGYTGRRPEESGYALDFPKRVQVVRDALGFDLFLDALVQRDLRAIEQSLETLNLKVDPPIRTTPYLTEALR